jgi:uncharacterized protein (TIGR03437 family)
VSRIVIVLFSFLFLVPQGLWATGTLQQIVMTKSQPSTSCPLATPPTAANNFSPADTTAYLWFYITGLTSADSISVNFYVAGAEYTTASFGPATTAGTCYTVTMTLANLPTGNWVAYIVDNVGNNTTQLGSVPFTITASTTCSYSLSSSSASVAATAGSGSFTVTAGSGCAWSATSSVSWLTTTSSGTGNGTVNYTVTANTTTSSRTGAITVGGQTFTVTQAAAATTTTGTQFTYNGFASTAGLTLVGSAATASTSDGTVLRLTPASGDQSGAAYSTTAVTLGNNATFSTQFQFRLSNPGGEDPADGIVFVLGTSTTGLGGVGVGMGYQGVGGNSVGIEFDTYNNAGFGLGNNDGNSSNHVAIDTNGVLTNTDLTNVYGNQSCGFTNGNPAQNSNTVPGCMSNGDLWTVNISYNGSTLTVVLTDPAEGSSFTAINNYAINLASILGQSTAYVGFTSGTGAGWENHDIVDWTFANATQSAFCTYSLSPTSASVAAAQSTGTIAVTASTGCTWNATSNAPAWLTTSSAGIGNGTVSYAVTANTSTSSRTGVITVVGQTFTVTQAGASSGGSTSITITNPGFETLPSNPAWISCAGTGCQDTLDGNVPGWTASNSTSMGLFQPSSTYFTLPLPSAEGTTIAQLNSGTLSQVLSATLQVSTVYTLQVDIGRRLDNLYPSPPPTALLFAGSTQIASATGSEPALGGWTTWTGTYTSSASDPLAGQALKIVLGATAPQGDFDNVRLTATPASGTSTGCSYSVNPTSIHATAAATSSQFIITTNTGCAWTASVPSGVTWITLTSLSGSGPGGVGYSITANTGAARSTTITVAGVSVAVSQDAACTYTLSATTSPLIPGVGGVGSVAVTVAGTSCSWNVATPSVSWVHVAGGSSSTSSGTVSYSVDSNTAASKRSTTLTIANQSYTVQQDVAPCTYALSSASSGTLAAGGASASFVVTAAGTACTWSITLPSDPNSQWIHVTSALNAMSSGAVSYTVDPNNTTSARNLSLTVNGKNPATTLTYTVSQAPGAANTAPPPIVNPAGIVNAASFISANLPAGSIAQGSFFSIFGNGLGPPNPGLSANSYPLGTNLGGVTVKVTQGSTSVNAIPLFVAQYQINAVMPSNTPTGTVQVTVSYNGLTSAPAPVQVVPANFGAFTVAGGHGPGIVDNYVSPTQNPLNTASVTAAPGDYVILWGTGLGPLPGGASDTLPPVAGSLPVSVQVLLGNSTISPSYAGRAPGLAGVDQIDFQLPSNVALGCYVPLQVVVNGNASNAVTMAINNNRQPCSDTSPFSATSRSGGANASILLARLAYTDPTNALKIGNGTIDIAMGTFNQSSGVGDLGFSLFASLPPINTCTYYNNVGSLNGLLGGQMPSTSNSATPLDAGPTITVQGPNGTQGVSYSDSSAQVSPYLGVLGTGGGWSALGLGPSTPFLDPGTYTVTGSGGKGVGPFQYTMQLPSGATWTNDSITSVNRSQGLNILWSGGNPSTQAVAIIGYSSNPATNVSGGFACLSDMAPQSFTVPSSILANLPATPTSNPGNAISALVVVTVPTANQFVQFSTSAPPSLTSGLGYYAVGELRNNVAFQ